MKDIEKMASTIKEIKEYQQMQKDLDAQIEALKDELKGYLTENGIDEITLNTGKAVWRETQANRFQTTEFKKFCPDLYKKFTKPTNYKRLTVN
jgi:predicted phage-related endonuclease